MLKTMLLCSLCFAIGALTFEGQAAKPGLARVTAFEYDGTVMPAVTVKDLKAAEAWYAKVLGSAVYYELAEKGWAEVTTPSRDCFLGLAVEETPGGSGGSFVSFGVKDITKAKAWLKTNGVRLDGEIIEIPETVKLLYFFDLDGNKLLFYEPYRAAAK